MIKTFEWFEQDYHNNGYKGEWPTMNELLSLSYKRFPNNIAFSIFEKGNKKRNWTFLELKTQIEKLGSYLIEKGIKRGDKVVIVGKNSPQWAFSYFAVQYCGGISVPLDCQLNTEKIVELGKFSGSETVFADKSILSSLPQEQIKNCFVLEDIESLNPEKIHPQVDVDCDDTAAILFTSGTTGNEKGVVLTHANFLSDTFMAADKNFLSVEEDDVMFALLPLHHSYCFSAVILETILHGCSCLFGQSIAPAKLVHDMREGKVSVFMGIPLIFNKLLYGLRREVKKKSSVAWGILNILFRINGFSRKVFHKNPGKKWFAPLLDGIGMGNMRICITGAGPLSPKVYKTYRRMGVNFTQGYGMTETSPMLTLNPLHNYKAASVGKILEAVDMKILNPDILGIGEIIVKGPNVCKGYYNDEVNSKALFTEDGYLKTGDIGSIDSQGYVFLKGRAKNIIVTEGGKNVFPEEIEDAFQLIPEVAQVMIRGYVAKKSTRSEGIEAVIYPNPDSFQNMNKDEIYKEMKKIVRSVNSNLVSYKKITNLTLLDEPMVMTTTRKIKRNKVMRTLEHIRVI